jgi:hypothetical protein
MQSKAYTCTARECACHIFAPLLSCKVPKLVLFTVNSLLDNILATPNTGIMDPGCITATVIGGAAGGALGLVYAKVKKSSIREGGDKRNPRTGGGGGNDSGKRGGKKVTSPPEPLGNYLPSPSGDFLPVLGASNEVGLHRPRRILAID